MFSTQLLAHLIYCWPIWIPLVVLFWKCSLVSPMVCLLIIFAASIINLIEVRLDAQSHQTGSSDCWGSSTVISETGSRGTTGCLRSITHLQYVFVKASQGGHPSPPQAVTILLCWEINSSCLTLSHPFVCYLINVMIGFWQVHLFHFQSLSQNDVQTGSLWPLCKLHCVD